MYFVRGGRRILIFSRDLLRMTISYAPRRTMLCYFLTFCVTSVSKKEAIIKLHIINYLDREKKD
jgi:hypothetical protein